MKAREVTSPRDIPYREQRIIVRWNKTRWRCREGYCERGSFTEAIAQVPARARTTQRLRTQIGAAIGDAARSVAEVAASHAVSWPTAHRAFVAHAAVALADPQPTAVLGIDETRRRKPRWERCTATGRWVRVDPWDTGFVDLAGDQSLLGQREGRTSATVIDWLTEINAFVTTGITNARTEGYNRLVKQVKQVKRVGCGFRNRDNSARRIRFHCTRKQRAATQTSC